MFRRFASETLRRARVSLETWPPGSSVKLKAGKKKKSVKKREKKKKEKEGRVKKEGGNRRWNNVWENHGGGVGARARLS